MAELLQGKRIESKKKHQDLGMALRNVFNQCDLTQGHMAENVAMMKSVIEDVDLTFSIPQQSNLLLVGGGSGTAVVGSSLFRAGVNQFTMLANSGEMGRDVRTGESVGGRLIYEEIPDAVDFMDALKQSTNATPAELRNNIHHLLSEKRHPHMTLGYFALEALRQAMGDPQKAIDFINYWMGNPYRVIPSTTDRTELFLDYKGQIISSFKYYMRDNPYVHADKPVLLPQPTLSQDAAMAIEQAKTVIIGPGDVFFSVLPHWGVPGFKEALDSNKDSRIVLIVNLTARRADTTDFKVTDYLDLYTNYLPRDRQIIALVNCGNVPVDNPLEDNIQGIEMYKNFEIVRANITGNQVSGNNQLLHNETNLGKVLQQLFS